LNPGVILSLLGLAACFVAALALVPFARDGAQRLGLIDQPNLERKQHARPIPRSGGLAIFPVFWGAVWCGYGSAFFLSDAAWLPPVIRTLAGNVGLQVTPLLALFSGCSIIFLLGVLDDRFDLPAKLRLAVQILATVPLIFGGVVLKAFLPVWMAIPLTMLWLVFLTNSFNFLDNMNGLTSGVSIVICTVMGLLAFLAQEWYMLLLFAMLAGTLLGFWFYNFPVASIFLGDAGSTHLGFLLGALAILATYYQAGVPTAMPVLIPLVVFGIPIFDTVSVMWIRYRAGKPFMVGDTNHISHRLVALGMSRKEAVLFIYAAALAAGLAAIPLRILDWRHGAVLVAAILLILLLLHWLERVSYRVRTAAPTSS